MQLQLCFMDVYLAKTAMESVSKINSHTKFSMRSQESELLNHNIFPGNISWE